MRYRLAVDIDDQDNVFVNREELERDLKELLEDYTQGLVKVTFPVGLEVVSNDFLDALGVEG